MKTVMDILTIYDIFFYGHRKTLSVEIKTPNAARNTAIGNKSLLGTYFEEVEFKFFRGFFQTKENLRGTANNYKDVSTALPGFYRFSNAMIYKYMIDHNS